MTSINVLLDKADHQYKLLQERKTALENLLVCIGDHSSDSALSVGQTQSSAGSAGTAPSSAASSASAINKNIQMLAQKYCGDCRNAFEELSKIIQVRAVKLDVHRSNLFISPPKCSVVVFSISVWKLIPLKPNVSNFYILP